MTTNIIVLTNTAQMAHEGKITLSGIVIRNDEPLFHLEWDESGSLVCMSFIEDCGDFVDLDPVPEIFSQIYNLSPDTLGLVKMKTNFEFNIKP